MYPTKKNIEHTLKTAMVGWLLMFSVFTLHSIRATAVEPDEEMLLHMISMERNDSARLNLMIMFFANTEQNNPQRDIEKARQLLLQSEKLKDKTGEIYAHTQMGLDYRSFGNKVASIKYYLKALSQAEASGNLSLSAPIYNDLGNIYRDLGDYERAIRNYNASESAAVAAKNFKTQTWALKNKGQAYLLMNRIDSALICSQEAYQLSVQTNYQDYLGDILTQLGAVQAKLGNQALALSFYRQAIQEAEMNRSVKALCLANTALSQYYQNLEQKDTAIFYAQQAINLVEHTAYSNLSLVPSGLLAALYKGSNCDSAIKYAARYQLINDSLYNAKSIQETQMITFEEELKKQERALESQMADEERAQYIQYGLIAVAIITIIILFLLLSRRFITHARLIAFFSVVALIMMFEFVNLLAHPFLEVITAHSPLLMLMGLVAIAAILIPVHHRIEAWTHKKLTEKNKAVLLLHAKKLVKKVQEGDV